MYISMDQIEQNYAIRQIFSGALSVFEKNAIYYHHTALGIEKRHIPFFFAFTNSSKRYVKANYFKTAQPGDMFEDLVSLPVPRGVISLTSASINSQAKTNRFSKIFHEIEVEDRIETVSSFAQFIPITLGVMGYIHHNNMNEMFDVFEQFSTTFSARQKFFYYDKGVKIAASLVMPSDFQGKINYDWTFKDESIQLQEFSIEITSFLLRINEITSRLASKVISNRINQTIDLNVPAASASTKKFNLLESPYDS